MRRLFFLCSWILLSSTPAVAADDLLSILESDTVEPAVAKEPSQSDEEKLLQRVLQKNGLKELTLAETLKVKTNEGLALQYLVLYRAGLPTWALENLTKNVKPEALSKDVATLWRLEVAADAPTLRVAHLKFDSSWTAVFGEDAVLQVLSRQVSVRDLGAITTNLNRTKANTSARALLEWKAALSFALQDNGVKASKILAHMMRSNAPAVGPDLVNLTAARLLYQNGYLKAASDYYQKVSNTSEYWPDAIDEASWALIRAGQFQDAVALTQSFVPDAVAVDAGPGVLVARSFAQVRICDFTGLAQSVQLFKQRFKDRTQALMRLEKNPDQPSVKKLFGVLKNRDVTYAQLGALVKVLPRHTHRDQRILQEVGRTALLENEIKVARAQGLPEAIAKSIAAEIEKSRLASLNVIQEMAKIEVADIAANLKRIMILEAEGLQRVVAMKKQVLTSKDYQKSEGTTGSRDRYALRFPADGEIWMDEVANYRVNLKRGCVAFKEVGL